MNGIDGKAFSFAAPFEAASGDGMSLRTLLCRDRNCPCADAGSADVDADPCAGLERVFNGIGAASGLVKTR